MHILFSKGIYTGKPVGFQLFLSFVLLISGAVVFSAIAMALFYACCGQAEWSDHPDMLRLLQLFSSVGTFLVPALGIAWLCSPRPRHYLSVDTLPGGRAFLLGIGALCCLFPTITLAEILNKQLELPAFLAPVEAWMQQQEAAAEQLTELLITGRGIAPFFSNLIVIALTAAVTEEFFFRGALQRLLGRMIRNPHTVIWAAACIFSFFHLQFYGFLPRLLLGAYFGYLLLWSKSLWLPVCAHFLNNAIAVVALSADPAKRSLLFSDTIEKEHLLPYSVAAFCMLAGFFFCCWHLKRYGQPNGSPE